MKKTVLFLNGKLGIKILEFLIECQDTLILAVVLNSPSKRSNDYKEAIENLISGAGAGIDLIEYSKDLWESLEFSRYLTPEVFGVSVLFGHIFPKSVIESFNRNLINLHPSLLPIGRGADPIFWSIVDNLPQGASIHRIDESIDTGEILVQEEIKINSWLNSGQIYEQVMEKLYHLYVEFYPNWSASSPSRPQTGNGTYHEVQELRDLKIKILEEPGELFKQLNLIQGLTYSDHRKAKVILPNKEVWEVSLNLKRIEG